MNMLATIDLGGTHCRFARFTVTARGLALDAEQELCMAYALRKAAEVFGE